MKKLSKILVIGAIVLVIGATSVTALAAPGYGARNTAAGYNSTSARPYNAAITSSADLEAFKAQRLEQMKAFLDAKVAAGTMTQAQADAFLSAMKERQENCTGTGSGAGMMNRQNGAGCGRAGYQNGAGCPLYNS